MADPAKPAAPSMELPPPTPVFDISTEHLRQRGGVFPQMYTFLWVSVAFVIGAILPWSADGKMVILQPILLVIALGCVWSSITGIRWRRLILWPILTIEMLAFVFLFLYYSEVKHQDMQRAHDEYERVAASQDQEAIDHYTNVTKPNADWGFFDLVTGIPSPVFDKVASPERKKVDHVWGLFGLGFHMSWLTTLFVGLFVVFQIATGIAKSKPKEDPAEARRAARRAAAGGKKSGAAGANRDEDKKFSADTTMKSVTDGGDGDDDESGVPA